MVHLQYRDMVDSQLIDADDQAGQAHRDQVANFLATNDAENLSLGIELDVRYDDSPVVVSDGSQSSRLLSEAADIIARIRGMHAAAALAYR
jgi:hypothetical protein